MLSIKNLKVNVDGKAILKGINLEVQAGEVHAIMGPNGSGKSTLANVLAGREGYEVVGGEVLFKGHDLLALAPEERAREGVFLAFQYPVEIPGVSNVYLLKAAVNAVRRHRGMNELDAMDFLALVKDKMKLVQMNEQFIYRAVNEGFSGGEKKRNEILQMALLEPALGILDETDSGLDIDALRIVASGVTGLSPEIMGLGPVGASQQALARAGMTIDDVDLVEINEAFAAQVIPSYNDLGIDIDKLNVNGGAIAVGHPFGMTGARITSTLLNGLSFHDKTIGLETMSVGGGQGMAMLFERLS